MKQIILFFSLVLMISSVVIAQVKVYKGTSSYTPDIEFTIHGNLTVEEFVAVWYTVKYRY
jgi:hypothetical protein